MTMLNQATRNANKMGFRHLVREYYMKSKSGGNTGAASCTSRYLHYYTSSQRMTSLKSVVGSNVITPSPTTSSLLSDSSRRYINVDSDQKMLDDMENDNYFPTYDLTDDDGEDLEDEDELEESKRQAIRDEIDSRTGRLWEDPWAITDEDWSSGKSYDDLPDWTEKICSRVSLERVKLHPDGVPTIDKLAALELPPSTVPHPALGNPHPYLKHRKKMIYNNIYNKVVEVAEPMVAFIQSMETWEEKQSAIDDLFEEIHDAVRYADANDNEYMGIVLGSQPNFPKLVERALEQYLKSVVKDEKMQSLKRESADDESDDGNDEKETKIEAKAEPIFMDILKAKDSTLNEDGIPKLLAPIKSHPKDGPGRMLEEWELSAKQDTKRIMCRECITEIAQALAETQQENSEAGSRVYVRGPKGAGKTAALAAIVASARMSGHIVLYLPDGYRLSRHGYYIEPNVSSKEKEELMFDLPILTNEVCTELLESHESDLEGMTVTSETLRKYISSDQMDKLHKEIEKGDDDEYSLIELLKVGTKHLTLGAGCYGAVVNTLMNQSDKPFSVVMDEFNTYFDKGHYFHEKYDANVQNSIPMNKITLFQPLVDAVGVERHNDGSIHAKEAAPMKRGSIVVGVTESMAVKRSFTAALSEAVESGGCKIVNVPQYSPLEVEHILANFEVIGLGRLRFDKGATVMNSQEVAYLRMISGGIGQRLLDSCIA